MATNTTTPKSTTAATEAPTDEFDSVELSRVASLIRAELSALVQDAKHKHPLCSKSSKKAAARRVPHAHRARCPRGQPQEAVAIPPRRPSSARVASGRGFSSYCGRPVELNERRQPCPEPTKSDTTSAWSPHPSCEGPC